jgi:hypothetical protein
MSLFEQFKIAVYKFKEYPKLLMVGWGWVILFFTLMCLISTAIISLGFVPDFKRNGGISAYVNEHLPEFTYRKGELECEPFDYIDEQTGMIVHIDTNGKAEDYDIGSYRIAYVADKDSLIVVNNGIRQQLRFKELDLPDMDKQVVANIFNSRKVRLCLYALFVFFIFLGKLMVESTNVMFIAIAGYVINRLLVQAQVSVGGILKLACYCVTFPMLLMSVVSLVGLSNNYIAIGMAGAYCYFALSNVKKSNGVVIAEL